MSDTTADLLKAALRRRLLRSAILKDAEAWQALYDALRGAYTRAWGEQHKAAVAAALDRLRELGPGQFTEDDQGHILQTLEAHVGAAAMEAALHGPVLNYSDALFRLGATEVGAAAGVDIAFMRPDLDALEVLSRGNLYWVGNHWNAYTKGMFDSILGDYFREGMTREQLTERFATDFAGAGERGAVYWELVADHAATKTREMGRVTGYARAGVEEVQVRAHLDHRTTPICRAMHGRVIAVRELSAQRGAYLDAVGRRDMEGAKRAWVMHRDASAVTGTPTGKLPEGTAGPPYHLRCRTITVIYFRAAVGTEAAGGAAGASLTEAVKRKTYNREALSRAELGELLARARSAKWRNAASAKDHWRRHGRAAGQTLGDYSAAAVDDLRRAGRDVYTAVSRGRPQLVVVRADGKRMWLTIVDVEKNTLITRHRRATVEEWIGRQDNEAVVEQSGRGIMKWRRAKK